MTTTYTIRKDKRESPLFVHELEVINDPQGRLLDLGAGEGTFEYDKVKCAVIAADKTLPSRLPRRPLVQCDAEALAFTPGVFDAVIANFSFEHFAHPDLVLSEIDRVLTKSGLLYISVPNAAALEDRLFRLLGVRGCHVQKYSFASLVRMVYRSTTLKLISFADWPAGYTWLTEQSEGSVLRRFIFRCLLQVKGWLRRYGRSDSGWVLLFAKTETSGYRSIAHVCEHCGAGASPGRDASPTWQCPQCGRTNRT